jgi:phosphate:Na+ symporter
MFDGWKFLAGLGIFLFGMFMLEESLRLLAGRSLKTLIRRFTNTRARALATGICTTAVLQSSSAVSLMVLAFVGAGLLTLGNAITVLMGAMLGTTFTAWIVALFGFSLKIDALALPVIGIGGLGLIVFGSSPRFIHLSKLLVAFGFLFLGLDFMKTSVEAFASVIDLSRLPDLGLWVYMLAGLVLTAVMQSSSAAIAVILTTLFAGIIDFGQGTAMVVGANVGTTVTILIGAIGGTPAKKQAALSSLVFNLGTALVVLPALPLFTRVIRLAFDPATDSVLGIAAFHTLFNLVGIILFLPAVGLLTRSLERLFPEERSVLTRFISNTSPEVPEAAITALRNEVLHQMSLSLGYIAARYRLSPRPAPPVVEPAAAVPAEIPVVGYADLERLHAGIFTFYAHVQAHELGATEAKQLEPVIRSSRSTMNATKNLHELLAEIEDIGRDDNPFLVQAHQGFKERLEQLRDTVDRVCREPDDERVAAALEQALQAVEEADKAFIRACSRAIARNAIREHQVTRLLMANRSFTQSHRMVVLSLQNLTRGFQLSAVNDGPPPLNNG